MQNLWTRVREDFLYTTTQTQTRAVLRKSPSARLAVVTVQCLSEGQGATAAALCGCLFRDPRSAGAGAEAGRHFNSMSRSAALRLKCTFKLLNDTEQFLCKETATCSRHQGANLLSVFTAVSFSPSQPAYEEHWECAEGWREGEENPFFLCLQRDSRASTYGSRG